MPLVAFNFKTYKKQVTVQNHLQNATHFVGVAYPPNRFPCKSVHSCKHDLNFCMKICLALNSYKKADKSSAQNCGLLF